MCCDCLGEGGVSQPGGQESNVYVLCSEPNEHKHSSLSARPGGSVSGVTDNCFPLIQKRLLWGPKRGFRALFCRKTEDRSGAFSGDSVRILGAVSPIFGPYLRFSARTSDFRPISRIFGPYLRFFGGNPNRFAEYQPRIISQGFYSKGSLSPLNV